MRMGMHVDPLALCIVYAKQWTVDQDGSTVDRFWPFIPVNLLDLALFGKQSDCCISSCHVEYCGASVSVRVLRPLVGLAHLESNQGILLLHRHAEYVMWSILS